MEAEHAARNVVASADAWASAFATGTRCLRARLSLVQRSEQEIWNRRQEVESEAMPKAEIKGATRATAGTESGSANFHEAWRPDHYMHGMIGERPAHTWGGMANAAKTVDYILRGTHWLRR